MTDVSRWDLHGPVRTVRTQFAEWNRVGGDWQPLRNRNRATFRPDGQYDQIDHHNPDGSVTRQVRLYAESGRPIEDQWWTNDVLANRMLHNYDEAGRLISSLSVDAAGTGREVERYQYDEVGRRTRLVFLSFVVTGMSFGIAEESYHDDPFSSEVIVHDANDVVLYRIVFSRDTDGRVLSQRIQLNRLETFLGPEFQTEVPTEAQPSAMEFLAKAFENESTYVYDDKGRRIETVRCRGQLGEMRVSVRYDDFGNPVERVTRDIRRQIEIADGSVKHEEMPSTIQHTRFEYQYDAHRNWTERIIWHRTEPNAEERRSQIERRTIEYYNQPDMTAAAPARSGID